MRLTLPSLALGLLLCQGAFAGDGTAAIGGGLGGALGNVVGQSIGGKTGAKAVASRVFEGAKTTDQNGFKITLAERTLAGVLAEARA